MRASPNAGRAPRAAGPAPPQAAGRYSHAPDRARCRPSATAQQRRCGFGRRRTTRLRGHPASGDAGPSGAALRWDCLREAELGDVIGPPRQGRLPRLRAFETLTDAAPRVQAAYQTKIWLGKSFVKFCKSFINLIKLVSARTCSSARVRARPGRGAPVLRGALLGFAGRRAPAPGRCGLPPAADPAAGGGPDCAPTWRGALLRAATRGSGAPTPATCPAAVASGRSRARRPKVGRREHPVAVSEPICPSPTFEAEFERLGRGKAGPWRV